MQFVHVFSLVTRNAKCVISSGKSCPVETYGEMVDSSRMILDTMQQFCYGPCSHYNPCSPGGRCDPTGPGLEDYKCHCKKDRLGKHCELGNKSRFSS